PERDRAGPWRTRPGAGARAGIPHRHPADDGAAAAHRPRPPRSLRPAARPGALADQAGQRLLRRDLGARLRPVLQPADQAVPGAARRGPAGAAADAGVGGAPVGAGSAGGRHDRKGRDARLHGRASDAPLPYRRRRRQRAIAISSLTRAGSTGWRASPPRLNAEPMINPSAWAREAASVSKPTPAPTT